MSDIFLSYASEDRDRVKSLARAFEEKGWTVWWDRRIPTGRSFDEVIQEALDASKTVVVVWTKTSVKSSWVKNEARKGLRRRVLFPVMLLEDVEIPLEFEHVQAAQLMGWQPEESHFGFDQFVQDIAQVLGPPSGPGLHQPPVKPLKKQPPSQTKPASKIESLSGRGRAGQVEQEGGRLKRKPSTPTAISAPLDSPRESLSPLAGTQSREPAQIHMPEGEGQDSGASGGTAPAQSQRYIIIGIGLLLVIGAILAYGIWSQGPSSSPARVEPPRTQNQVTTARPIAGQAKNITGKDGAPMVLIPAGEFWMGSPDGEEDANEHPRHRVYLDAYSMDRFEVMVSRYAEFMRSTGRRAPHFLDQVKTGKHSDLPVVGIDWQDAEAYCRWGGEAITHGGGVGEGRSRNG